MRADAERLIELYGDWTRALLDGFTELAEGRNGDGGLAAGPAAAGAVVTTTAWLHTPRRRRRARCAPVHAPISSPMTAPSSRRPRSPSTPPILGPAATTPTEIRVSVVRSRAGTAPGTYHGTVLAAGLPEVAPGPSGSR